MFKNDLKFICQKCTMTWRKNKHIFFEKYCKINKKRLFEWKNKQKNVLIFIDMYKNDNKSLKL